MTGRNKRSVGESKAVIVGAKKNKKDDSYEIEEDIVNLSDEELDKTNEVIANEDEEIANDDEDDIIWNSFNDVSLGSNWKAPVVSASSLKVNEIFPIVNIRKCSSNESANDKESSDFVSLFIKNIF